MFIQVDFSAICSLVKKMIVDLIFHASHNHILIGAAKSYGTLNNILNKDVENVSVKKKGSHSWNLRRVRLGLGLVKALFEQFLSTEYVLFHPNTSHLFNSKHSGISG